MAAEDLLREAGFRLEVVPPPRALSAGCGLAVLVSLDDVEAAMGHLRSREAVWEAVHRLGPAREVVEKLG
jgi:Putative Se/S carrier protein-like